MDVVLYYVITVLCDMQYAMTLFNSVSARDLAPNPRLATLTPPPSQRLSDHTC